MLTEPKKLIPLHAMARLLYVSPAWLKSEALAGRIPHLDAGGKLLFNRDVIERIMLDRATTANAEGAANA